MAEALQVNEETPSRGGRSGNGAPPPAPPAEPNWLSQRWARWRQFLHDVRVEMSKVTWPTWNDVKGTTVVVLLTVAFFGVYFVIVDWGAGHVVQQLFKFFRK